MQQSCPSHAQFEQNVADSMCCFFAYRETLMTKELRGCTSGEHFALRRKDSTMIFCYGEGGQFPESEFVHTQDGKVFHPSIHHVQPEHWATTGMVVDPEVLTGVDSYDRAQGIIHLHITKIPAATIPGVLGEEEDEEGEINDD